VSAPSLPLISLVHPSRGRPAKALATLDHWRARARAPERLEHLLSLDADDPELPAYVAGFAARPGTSTLVHANRCVVEATNQAARYARGQILVYLSDDFACPEAWDLLLGQAFAAGASDGRAVCDSPRLVKVDDCLQQFLKRVLTIPIMNRALYQALGYFWHPDYRSMFVDQDLFEVCLNRGWLVLRPDLRFPHEHPANGKAADDETYRRSSANWEQGKAVFLRRAAEGFAV